MLVRQSGKNLPLAKNKSEMEYENLLEELEKFRLHHRLKKVDIARMLGAKSQVMNNWYARGSLPKDYILKVSELISSDEVPQNIEERLVEHFRTLNVADQELLLNFLNRLTNA